MKLRGRISVISICCFLITILIWSFIWIPIIYSNSFEETEDKYRELLNETVHHFEDYIQDIEHSFDMISTNEVLLLDTLDYYTNYTNAIEDGFVFNPNDDEVFMINELIEERSKFIGIDFLYIGFPNGSFISDKPLMGPGARSNEEIRDYDPTSRPWYNDAVNNPDKIIITNIYMKSAILAGTEVTDSVNYNITFTKAYTDEQGNILFVIGADISFLELMDILSIEKEIDSLILLMSDSMLIITADEFVLRTDLSQILLSDKMFELDPNDSMINNIRGEDRLQLKANMSISDWSFFYQIRVSTVNSLVGEQVHFVVIPLLVLFVLLVMSVLIVLNFNFIGPLKKLRNSIIGITKENDLSRVVEYKGNDEIAELAISFNSLISDLKDTSNETTRLMNESMISEQRLRASQKIAKVGSWELNLLTNEMWASDESFLIYEIDNTNNIIDLPIIQNMLSKEDRVILDEALLNTVKNKKPYDVQFALMTLKGNKKYISSKAELSYTEDGRPYKLIGSIHDITEIKTKKLELEYLAFHDYLTGLNNRRYYTKHLKMLDVEENLPITVVMADINGLKLINDAFGHLAGDELLLSASKVIKDNCRSGDLLARIGGDEFAIVLLKTSKIETDKIIKKIRSDMKKIYINSIQLSVSFGYMTKTHVNESIDDLCQSAEDLMYREKLLEIPSMRSNAIETILSTLYEKDVKSEAHSRDVAAISEKLAIKCNLSNKEVSEIRTAGLLHDIGKIVIPLSIITKEGELTDLEYEQMQTHPEIGFRILNSTHTMRDISHIVLNHHERWDGQGYPKGIKGQKIPLSARIVSIADAFDAMTSPRTYKEVSTKKEALQEIINNAGTQFDPQLVKVFSENFEEIVK